MSTKKFMSLWLLPITFLWAAQATPQAALPEVPGAVVTLYAEVIDPVALAFDTNGVLYAGRDLAGTTGNSADSGAAVKIHRIGAGGSPVEEYGNTSIYDPDGVVVDTTGAFTGVCGTVLVVGDSTGNSGRGQVSRIAPDGSVSVLFGPNSLYPNPNYVIFDRTGRLILSDSTDGTVAASSGSMPSSLCNVPGAGSIAVDAANQLYVCCTANHTIRIFSSTGTLLSSSFGSNIQGYGIDCGPGGPWGNDIYCISIFGELLRLNPASGVQRVIGTGFGSGINDLKFGPDGALYASDLTGDCIYRVTFPPSLSIAWQDNKAALTLAGWTNHTYRIEYSPVLPALAWTPLTTCVLQSTPFVVQDDIPRDTPSRFYRAVQVDQVFPH